MGLENWMANGWLTEHRAIVNCVEICAYTYVAQFPLTLPSPARGEGSGTPSLDGRGKGEGDPWR